MNRAFRTWLLLCFLGYAILVRLLAEWDARLYWLILLPVALPVAEWVHRLRGAEAPSPISRALLRVFFRLRFFLRRRMGIRLASRVRGPGPRGFCPKCGYPMNPGRCPECGTDVSLKRLSRSARPAVGREAKIAIFAGVLAVLIVGGYWAYDSGVWASRAPTSWLLWLHKKGVRNTKEALRDRFYSGTMTGAEEEALCRRSFRMRLYMKPPYSRDCVPVVALTPGSSMPELHPDQWVYVRDPTVSIDGKPGPDLKWPIVATEFGGVNLRVPLGRLAAGEHKITVRGRATIAPAQTWTKPELSAVFDGPFEATATLIVEDRDARDIFVPVSGEDVAAQARDRVYIEYQKRLMTDEHGQLVSRPCLVILNQMSFNAVLAGRVSVRRSGEGEHHFVTNLIQMFGEEDVVPIDHLPGLAKARHVDVRIEPDATLMPFFRTRNEMNYIDVVVERKKIRRETAGLFGN